MANGDIYEGTIKVLVERRSHLNAEIQAIDKAIAILTSVGSTGDGSSEKGGSVAAAAAPSFAGMYSLVSMRWACLWILAQAGKVGLSTLSIAGLLEKGGRTSKAERFASSVSAVLSNMKIKGEVDAIGNYWTLTPSGQSALTAILPRLKVLADQHLKYSEKDIKTMPLSKAKELLESNDVDYTAACDYYFGGASAVPNSGPY